MGAGGWVGPRLDALGANVIGHRQVHRTPACAVAAKPIDAAAVVIPTAAMAFIFIVVTVLLVVFTAFWGLPAKVRVDELGSGEKIIAARRGPRSRVAHYSLPMPQPRARSDAANVLLSGDCGSQDGWLARSRKLYRRPGFAWWMPLGSVETSEYLQT